MDENTKQFIKEYFKNYWLHSKGEIILSLTQLENFKRIGGKLLNKVTKYTIKVNNKIVAHAFKKYGNGREILPELEFID